MTIHSENPFLDPEPDPVRRFRGRTGGVVSLWTSGAGETRAGLTVSSLMVAAGEQGRLLALLDPDSDLFERLRDTGRAVVALLAWADRDLAEAFAGKLPAPGGVFGMARFEPTGHGPRLMSASTYGLVRWERDVLVGWSALVTTVIEELHFGEDREALVHRRGRYYRYGTGER